MNHYALAALLTFITSSVLTVFVFFKDNKSHVNKIFIQLSFILAIYGLSFFKLCVSDIEVKALFWGKLTMFTSIAFAITYIHLSLIVLDEKVTKKFLIFIYSILIIYALVDFPTNLILRDPRPAHGIPLMNRAGLLYIPSVILFLGIISYGVYKILQGMKKSSPAKRNQLKYFILAPIVAVLAGSSNFIVAYDITFYPINPFIGYLGPFFNIIIAYAIIKHRIMNIDLAWRYGTSYIFYALVNTSIFILLIYFSRQWFLGISLLVLVCSLFAPYLYRLLTGYLTPTLLGSKYEYLNKLDKLIKNQESLYTTKDVIKKLIKNMESIMQLKHIAFFMIQENKKKFYPYVHLGLDNLKDDYVISIENDLVELLRLSRKPIIKEELEKEKRNIKIVEIMNDINAEAAFPFFVEDLLIGVLFLGKKESNDMYHTDDIEKLEQIVKITERTLAMELEYKDKVLKIQNKYQQHLISTTKRMIEIRDLDELAKDIVHILMRSAEVLYVGVYFLDKEDKKYKIKYETGDSCRKNIDYVYEESYFITLLKQRGETLSISDLKRWSEELRTQDIKNALEIGTKLGGKLIVPIIVDRVLGFIVIGDKREDDYSNADWNTFDLVAYSASMSAYSIALSEEVIIDSLTGLYNRGHFEDQLTAAIPNSIKYDEQLSCIMTDIDHFKKYNDTHGHQYGDKVLRAISNCLSEEVRPNDLVCRFGGEEFVLILPNTDLKGAVILAERLRKATKENLKLKEPITISLGVATLIAKGENREYNTKEIKEKLIKSTDAALYNAKDNGRDRVESNKELILENGIIESES